MDTVVFAGAGDPQGDARLAVQGERAGSAEDVGAARLAGSLRSAAERTLPGAKVNVTCAAANRCLFGSLMLMKCKDWGGGCTEES